LTINNLTVNQRVAGSSPAAGANMPAEMLAFLFIDENLFIEMMKSSIG
jgi:hypothetical protein